MHQPDTFRSIHRAARTALFALALSLALSLGFPRAARAAYIRDFPITLAQPDGTVLHLLQSGDEYYNWIHDQNGYVILQDSSGAYVYAEKQDGQLVPSTLRVGSADPAAAGIEPGLKPDASILEAQRATMFRVPATRGASRTPKTGTFTNVIIFIRFSDDAEFTTARSTYDNMLNGTGNSLKAYYQAASYNKLTINSEMYPVPPGTTIVSYQDSHPRKYYEPYNATTNPTGYTDQVEADREQSLLAAAVAGVSAQIPSGLIVDADDDGRVDNVCFVVKGAAGPWSSLLWPHMWVLYTRNVYINGKVISNYNLQVEDMLLASYEQTSVLCHEMGHSLGLPDLYRYTNTSMDPVGGWDLMANNANPPQQTSNYNKWHYLHWITSIPTITTAGTYTLNPSTASTNNAYIIRSPYSTTEYLEVEYRRKTGQDATVPGSGLIVTRINTAAGGNASGPPDEEYIYRLGGTLSANGNYNYANFSADVSRTAITENTSPSTFLYNNGAGGLSGINITNIGSAGSTITFSVSFRTPDPVKLAIAPFYGDAAPNTILPFQPTVTLLDSGNKPTNVSSPVTITLKPGTGTDGAVLSGTTTVNAVSGVATFKDLQIDKPGSGYVFVATSGTLPTVESAPFNVVIPPAVPKTMAFDPMASDIRAGDAFQARVSLLDDAGQVCKDSALAVSVRVKDGTGFGGTALNGTLTVNAVAGVATFTDLRIASPANGFVLTASNPTVASADSQAFNVLPFTYNFSDAGHALRWAAGLENLTQLDIQRYDVNLEGDSFGQVDIQDAISLLRIAAGLDPKP